MKFQKYPWTVPQGHCPAPPTYRSPHNKRSTSLNDKCQSKAEWNGAERRDLPLFLHMSFRSNMSHILQQKSTREIVCIIHITFIVRVLIILMLLNAENLSPSTYIFFLERDCWWSFSSSAGTQNREKGEHSSETGIQKMHSPKSCWKISTNSWGYEHWDCELQESERGYQHSFCLMFKRKAEDHFDLFWLPFYHIHIILFLVWSKV